MRETKQAARIMKAIKDAKRLDTFLEARGWVRMIETIYKARPYDLEFHEPCFYLMTCNGEVIGRGMTFIEAIQDGYSVWSEAYN